MKLNKKLLPIKGHYFLFNAGTAPLVPYLSTYARQLGFSSATVGLIYTVLPIFGLVAKPLFGVIADRFKIQKSIFIIFQIVTIVSFSAIYFIPGENSSTVQVDCRNGETVLRSCYQNAEAIDQCKLSNLENENGTANCNIDCDMTSPKMWQTICEHWHIPQYCFSATETLQFISNISNVSVKNDKCLYMTASNVILDGNTYTPQCMDGMEYVDIDKSCRLNCTSKELSVTVDEEVYVMCSDKMLTYKVCKDNFNSPKEFEEISNGTQFSECLTFCNKVSARRLMELCNSWNATHADACHPKANNRRELPENLTFFGKVSLSSVKNENECINLPLAQIELPDGSIYYSNCLNNTRQVMRDDLLRDACHIKCDSTIINELVEAASDSQSSATQYTKQFWLFFLMMIISWIGQAVVVTFADAICFNLLGTKVSHYGKQRLWGSVGWGIFSLLTGSLIDWLSDGAYKDYTIAFILMFVFMCGDVAVSCFVKTETTQVSINILADVGTLLSSLPTFVFMLWTIAVGLSTGLLWQFLFWLLEDISNMTCNNSDYIKTLQGLVSAIQTFCGEIPFMFVSGYILKKLGHVNMMSIVLFAFGVRFILYSFLTNPWWVLPIEMFQGVTFGMFYPTMTSYANVVSPPGTETTVQGLVGAIFEGVGTSLGSFVGGRLYETYGGAVTFRWFGILSLVCCAFHVIVQCLLKTRRSADGLMEGKETGE